MTKRGHREGSITRARDRWRVRMTLDNGRRVSLGCHDTEEEAEAVLAEARRRVTEADLLTGAVTVAAFGRRVLEARELDGVRGMRSEWSTYRRHVVASELGPLPLAAVTRRDVERWVRALLRRPGMRGRRQGSGHVLVPTGRTLSRQSVIHALRILRAILEEAAREELVEANPAAGVRVPKQARTDDPWTWLTAEEIDAVLDCDAIPVDRRLIYQVAIFTGLRAGELWGLRWADVHLEGDRPELVVRHSRGGPTKGGRPGRVPLLEPARAALARWATMADDARPDALVWPAEGGGHHANGFDAGWADHPERLGGELVVRAGHKSLAGISRPVRFHDLRHTCASHLVMGTWGRPWRLEEVRGVLRHQSIAMTQRYAHLAPDALHSAAAATDGVGHGLVTGSRGVTPAEAPDPPALQGDPAGAPGRIRTSDLQLRKPLGERVIPGTSGRCDRLVSSVAKVRAARLRLLAAVATGDPMIARLGVAFADAVEELEDALDASASMGEDREHG